jgi:hypothetical protein
MEPKARVKRRASPEETQDVPVYKSEEPTWAAPAPVEEAPVAEAPVEEARIPEAAPAPEPKQLDVEALVARVLEKMSPDVMQKVTHEILKPVIEALVKEELDSHKS